MRIDREKKTIKVMIGMYCNAHHTSGEEDLCLSCNSLHTYAMERIDKCPLLPEKPACSECPVHCYKPQKREDVRQVMRYAGPRMIWKHPVLALFHIIDKIRYKKPVVRKFNAKNDRQTSE